MMDQTVALLAEAFATLYSPTISVAIKLYREEACQVKNYIHLVSPLENGRFQTQESGQTEQKTVQT